MTFETIINTANARATALGKTLIFGDTAVQNVAANELGDDFFTLDVRLEAIRIRTYQGQVLIR